VRPVASSLNKHIKGQSVLLFKPPLGFSTAAIFQALGKSEKFSLFSEVEQKLSNWESQNLSTDKFLANDLELPVFEKHIYIPALFLEIEEKFSLVPRLSGSGSCCFCLGNDRVPWSKVENVIRKAWGEEAYLTHAQIV
jgi:4-diphosphocytidyl-2C-methyl-D-erythritol kinase